MAKNEKNAPAAAKAPAANETSKEVKVKRITKKNVVMQMLERPNGASIEEMAQRISKLGIDPDVAKNARTVRLWLSKLPYKCERKEKRYFPMLSKS